MTSFFTKLFYLVNKNKWLTILLALLMLAVCGFFASKITFEEDITKVIPKSQQGDITTKVVQQLKFSDKITVLIAKSENGTVDDLTQTAAAFLDELKCCADYIKNVQGKVDDSNIQQTFDFVYNHLPLFLETEEYEKIENRLAKDSIALLVEKNLKTLIFPTGIVAKDFIVADPMGISFMALEKSVFLGCFRPITQCYLWPIYSLFFHILLFREKVVRYCKQNQKFVEYYCHPPCL